MRPLRALRETFLTMSRITLKGKLILFVLMTVMLLMMISSITLSVILSRQHRAASNDAVCRALNIVVDELSNIQEEILSSVRYIATEGDKGGQIKYLAMYKAKPNYDMTRDAYFEIVQNIYDIALTSHLRKILIYDFDGDMTAYVLIENEKTLLGFPDRLPDGTIQYRAASLKTGDKLNKDSWEIREMLNDFQPKISNEMPNQAGMRFEYAEKFLSLAAYHPIMGQVFNKESKQMESKQMGIVIASKALDDTFISKMSAYSGVKIGIFSAGGLSTGTAADYKTFRFDGIPKP